MFLLHLFLFTIIIIPSTLGYIFVKWTSAVSWNDANDFCYKVYKTRLASIHSQSDNNIVTDLCSAANGHCYIGLQITIGAQNNTYNWFDGTSYNYVVNWSANNPSGDNGQNNTCGSIINSEYDDITCTDSHTTSFVCNEQVTTRFIVYWYSTNWTNAEGYCQSLYNSHLATIVNEYENNEASKWIQVQNGAYWFGLHDSIIENVWRFISEPHAKYEEKYYNWNPGEPNNAGNEDCGEFGAGWNDFLCHYSRWFMCDGYQFGGSGGNFFSYTGIERLNGITKWGFETGTSYQAFMIESFTVDNINNITQNEYRTGGIGGWGVGNECTSFMLGNNEYINQISMYLDTGSLVHFCGLGFVTNLNNTYECYRQTNCYLLNTIKYTNSYLSGFYGRYGAFIDSMNVNMNKLPYPQTFSPTKAPTQSPTNVPTYSPTNAPTNNPTYSPTDVPTYSPTNVPTNNPTIAPTDAPTNAPSNFPTYSPTNNPTNAPTMAPTNFPSDVPTLSPSDAPTNNPSNAPSISPTILPSNAPTMSPSLSPSESPTISPSIIPTNNPTYSPTNIPTNNPTNLPLDLTTQTLPPQNSLALTKNLKILIISLILGGVFCLCLCIYLCYVFKKNYDESIRKQVLHNLSSMSGMSTLQTLPSQQANMDTGMSSNTSIDNGLSYVDHATPAYSSDKHEFENGIQMATVHTYEKEGNDTRINNNDEKAEIEDSKEDMYGTKDDELYEGNGRKKGVTIGGDTAGPDPANEDNV